MALKDIQIARYDPTYQSGWAAGLNALSGAIGQVDQAFKDKTEREKQEEKEEMMKRQMLMEERMMLSDTFTPEVPETDSEEIRDAKLAAGRKLADKAATLNRQYRDGHIEIEEFQKQYSELQGSLQKIQQGDQFLGTVAQLYDDFAADPNTLSAATSPEAVAVMKAVKDGTVNVSIDDDGKAMYTGYYIDANGEAVEVKPTGVGSENSFPAVIAKVQPPGAELYNFNVNLNKGMRNAARTEGDTTYTGTTWNPAMEKRFKDKIDTMVNDQTAISYAVDYLGVPRAQAMELYNSGELVDTVKSQLLVQSRDQFFGNQKEQESLDHKMAIQEEQLAMQRERFNWARLDRKNQEALNAAGVSKQTWGEKSFQLEVQGWAETEAQIRGAFFGPGGARSVDLGRVQGLLHDKGVTVLDNDTLLLKNGEEIDIPTNPQAAYNMIIGFLGDPKVVAAYNAMRNAQHQGVSPSTN